MIEIKSIQLAGGACPYQIEATTSAGEFFYLRYRGGRLRAGVSKNPESFGYKTESYNVIDVKCGEELDGWADHARIMPLLEGKIIFPKGFKLDSSTRYENDMKIFHRRRAGSINL
jgi:hypothetical protein